METLYTYCAAIGAALLIGQLLLSLIGFGDHDVDSGHGIDFHGIEIHGADVQGSLHGETHVDHFDRGGHWYVGFLSFRAIVTALAVFGLIGLGLSREFVPPRPAATLLIALASAAAVMYAVAWLLRTLYALRSDGTVRIERAVGLSGSVYLTIPAKKAGFGKVTVKIQDRTMEYTAVTAGDEIPTGTAVVVQAVLTPQIIEVASATAVPEQPFAGQSHV
jgi:hypothetical protein